MRPDDGFDRPAPESASLRPSMVDDLLSDPDAAYRFLVEHSTDILAIHEPDGRPRWISASVEQVLGWTADQRLSRNLQLIHEEDVPLVTAARLRLVAGADSATARIRLLRADGTFRWADSIARAIRDDHGRIQALVVITRDIHEQVLAEDALAASERRYRLLTESMRDVVWTMDTETLRFTYVSPSVEALRGFTPEEIMAEPMDAALTPDAAAWLRRDIAEHRERLRAGTEPFGIFYTEQVEQPCKDGGTVWTEVVGSYRLNEETGRIEFRAVTRDISQRRAAVAALAASEERYRLLAENSSDVVLHVRDGMVEWVSPSLQDVLGWWPEDWIGAPVVDFVHPHDIDDLLLRRQRISAGGTERYRTRVRDAGDEFHWIEVHARPYLDAQGQADGITSTFRVVDEEVRAAEALARSEELFRTAMESAPTGIAVVDLDRRFMQVNPALCRMLGRDADWLLGHRVPDLLDPETDALDLRMRSEVLAGRVASTRQEKRLRLSDGSTIWVEHSIAVLHDDAGLPRGYVSQFVNVTDARAARESLRFLATHDALTRLVNRTELLERMHRILSHPPRTGTKVATLFIDLDGLKAVNDSHGHAVGDAVIVAVADRIAAHVRSGDIVSRIGGDEYVVILPAITSVEDAKRIAGKIQEAVAEPIHCRGLDIVVSVSIGVSLAEHGDDAEHAIDRADHALYQAKRAGRARTVTHDGD